MGRGRSPGGRGERAVSGAFIAVLSAVFLCWWRSSPGLSAAGLVSAAASAALFAAVSVRFLGHWLADWSSVGGEADPAPPTREDRITACWVFLCLLALDAAVILFVFLLQMACRGETDFRGALDFWTCTDSQHYLAIARDGYLGEGSVDRLVQLVFLPGYPLAIRAARLLTGDELTAGFLVSGLSFAGGGAMLYRLARLDMDRDGALRAVRFLCLLPGAFFFAAPMSESLFLLLSVSCIYHARKKRWLPACLLGGLAAFTRSLGLALAVPVGYELVTEALRPGPAPKSAGRQAARFAALLLIPAGFAAYCWICRAVSGDPFRWAVYQREHWHQAPGLFFSTAAYQTENALEAYRERSFPRFMGLWLPNLVCSFSALGLMAAAVRRLRPSYGAYFIAYYAVAIGATWLLSAPRYLTVLFPICLALAVCSRRRGADTLLTLSVTAAGVLYALLFVCRWQVW